MSEVSKNKYGAINLKKEDFKSAYVQILIFEVCSSISHVICNFHQHIQNFVFTEDNRSLPLSVKFLTKALPIFRR